MNRYRKKPVVIEAIQFTGTNAAEIQALVAGQADIHFIAGTDIPVLVIRTLEGSMSVSKDDWVIRGVKGEYYPCKPDIFSASYEPADQEVTA